MRMSVEPEGVTLTPGGEPAVVEVRVYNLSDVVEEFAVSLVGRDVALDAAPQTLRLLPNSNDTVTLQLRLAEGPVVTAGTYRPMVEVHARGVHDHRLTGPVEVVVPPSDARVAMDLEPTSVRAGRSARVRLAVTNPGNAPLQVMPRGSDPEAVLRFRFQPEVVDLPPGGSSTVHVQLDAPSPPWTGGERACPFTVELVDGAGSGLASATGTLVQKPWLTEPRRTTLRWALTLVGGLTLIVGAFTRWTVEPVVRTGLQWSVPDYLDRVFREMLPLRPLHPAVPDALVSVGMGVIVLAALSLLGLVGRGGGVSRLAAGVAFLGLAGVFTALALTGPLSLAAGAWLCLGGALVAFAGGLVARR